MPCAVPGFELTQSPLSQHENLTLEDKQTLKTLLRANERLNTAYLRHFARLVTRAA